VAAEPARLIVGISGASGSLYGVRVLDALKALGVESHLVVSKAAALTLSEETDLSLADLTAKATVNHRIGEVGAAIASGSFKTLGMIVAPCSVRTMSEIATGVTSTLLTRAADVTRSSPRPCPPSTPSQKVSPSWSTSRWVARWICSASTGSR
jgi:4-hydroxy-3-polyprenylbenzoate decarboxylase